MGEKLWKNKFIQKLLALTLGASLLACGARAEMQLEMLTTKRKEDLDVASGRQGKG